MPRALLERVAQSFGLVNVPVAARSAPRATSTTTSTSSTRRTRQPIEQRRYCSEEDVEVMLGGDRPRLRARQRQGGHASPTRSSRSVEPRKTRTIEIEAFVDLADVDPIYFDHPYFLVPAGESEGTLRAYQLLVEAMGSQRARRARAVRDEDQGVPRRRPGARRRAGADDDALPRRGQADRGMSRPAARSPPSGRSTMPCRSSRSSPTDWEPENYTDCYRERLRRVIERKRKGQTIEAPPAERQPKPGPRPDGGAAAHARRTSAQASDPRSRVTTEARTSAGSASEELYERAQREKIPGRTKMSKKQLVEALSGE